MEKERRVKALVIVTLLIAVIGLSVAFAALSQTLTINGSAKLDASKWGLKFDNLVLASDDKYIEGTANIKTDDNTVIENMNVRLTTPGDKVVYKVDLVNEGSINAKIDEIVKTTTPNYISFKVYMGNTGNDELNEGYVLGKETRIPLRIEIEFIKNITKDQLPTEARTIGLSYGVTFVQTDEKLASGGQTPSTLRCTIFEKKDTYSVGDEIALCNNDTNKSEDFYVISDNGDTVTALAKYNLLVGNYPQLNVETGENEYIPLSETEENYGLQSERAKGSYNEPEDLFEGLNCDSPESSDFPTCLTRFHNFQKNLISIAFAEDKNHGWGYWVDSNGNLLSKYGTSYPAYVLDENSLLYEPLNNYKSYIKTTLGKTSVSTSLLTYEQATSLGCTTNGWTCKAAPNWVYSTSYWLGSADYNNGVWYVDSNGGFYRGKFSDDHFLGFRPVITISKTDL